jgi:hypothetical protein
MLKINHKVIILVSIVIYLIISLLIIGIFKSNIKKKETKTTITKFYTINDLKFNLPTKSLLEQKIKENTSKVLPRKILLKKHFTNIKKSDKLKTYKINLSKELQIYTYQICMKYNVDYKLALAIMKHESNFNPNVISKTNDYRFVSN